MHSPTFMLELTINKEKYMFEVKKNELTLSDSFKFDVGLTPNYYRDEVANEFVKIPESFQVMDTTNNEPISNAIVGSQYNPDAYYKMIAVLSEAILKSNIYGEFHVQDSLFDGKGKFVREIRFPNLTITPKTRKVGDIIEFRIRFRTSLDGSWMHLLEIAPIRLACLNGQTSAIHKLMFANKHTSGFSVDTLRINIQSGIETFQSMGSWFESLSNREISESNVREILNTTLFKNQVKAKADLDKNKTYNWMINQFYQESKNLGMTMYACYNMLTHWASHTPHELRTKSTRVHQRQYDDNQKVLFVLKSPVWNNYMN